LRSSLLPSGVSASPKWAVKQQHISRGDPRWRGVSSRGASGRSRKFSPRTNRGQLCVRWGREPCSQLAAFHLHRLRACAGATVPEKGTDRDHRAVPGGLVGRRGRAAPRRRHVQISPGRGRVQPSRCRRRDRLQACRRPEGGRLFAVWNSNSISTTFTRASSRSTTVV
jgi:hypothetical protein